ncbi:PEP/pyruvate-binding domain-containing protein [Paenibacillus kobensis]|uniref:PEP/pyruvate-binding domain-containing protein n=1 Tax=Paenibacillus kobensis TaxID=59841 RepID=UPI000FDB0609|nr:PEP/pyruvate-binding domain-containing protein [Paenibacillus kobensis]
MTAVQFGTKAETLERLEGLIPYATVLPQFRFLVEQWDGSRHSVIHTLASRSWLNIPLIVRSSAQGEDGFDSSMAGRYVSVLDVRGEEELERAVEQVRASYSESDPSQQIFIQPMLDEIALSGVAFSVDPNSGGQYIVINYDDSSGSTSSVTSGSTNMLSTYYYFKGAKQLAHEPLDRVVSLVMDLESLLHTDKLDIEFAMDSCGNLYLLQVRPLIVTQPLAVAGKQAAILSRIHEKALLAQARKPYLYGKRTVYGVMPDWNPAEIIGIRPRPLALSLYKELVTDSIWAYQRSNYGYKNVRSFPLLMNFGGIPYIDVRVSFNSFVPEALDDALSDKLLNYYLDKLTTEPHYHDKVEFEILFSCFTFDLEERVQALHQHSFTNAETDELCRSLKRLTNHILSVDNGLLTKDLAKIDQLDSKRQQILDSPLDTVSKIYWLLEDCKRYGTLPFAGLARGGFVAVQMLRSLIETGILNEQEYNNYMSSLETVSSRLSADLACLAPDEFLARYGHLRPGTYDIRSARYDEAPDRYFDFHGNRSNRDDCAAGHEKPSFSLTLKQFDRIKQLLVQHDLLGGDVLTLFAFFKLAIEGREYSKFVFTKSLSDALRLFGQLAEELGFTIEDASYADIRLIKQAYESECDLLELMTDSISAGKKRYADTLQLTLPPLITEPSDVWAFSLPEQEPNYVTLKSVTAPLVFVEELDGLQRLDGAIVMIESADPGYDWIFAHKLAGFITMFGGANSHMAIRAGELTIPAVIGVGETLFQHYSRAKVLAIDCAGKKVSVVQ